MHEDFIVKSKTPQSLNQISAASVSASAASVSASSSSAAAASVSASAASVSASKLALTQTSKSINYPNKPPNHTNKQSSQQMEADSGTDFAAEKPESHSPEKREKKKKQKKRETQLANAAEAVTGDDLTATEILEDAPSSSKFGDKKRRKRKKEYDAAAVGENESGTRNRDGSDDTKGTEAVTSEEPITGEKKTSNALTANTKNGVEEAPSVTKSSDKKSKKRDKEKDVAVGGENGTANVSESGKEHVSNVKDISATMSADKKRKKRKKENNVLTGGENGSAEMKETGKDGDSDDSITSKRMSKKNGKKGKDVVSSRPGHSVGNGAAEMAGDVKEGDSYDSINNSKHSIGNHLTASDVILEALSPSKSDDKKSRKRKKENDVLAGRDNSTKKISEEVLGDSIIMKPGPKKKRNKEKDVGVGGSGHMGENGTNEGDSDNSATSKPRPKKKRNKGKDVIGASDNSQNADPRTKKPSKPRKRVSFAGEVEVFDDKGKSSRPEEDNDDLVQGKRFTPEEDDIIKDAVRNYIERNQLGEEGLQMVLNNKKYPHLIGCWKEIGASVPWRPFTAIYFRAHNLFERSEARKWQPHEYETLKQLHEQFGSDWKMIAAELGKHRIHVKDTWRRIKLPNARRGNWSQEEYQSLFDLVNMDLAMKAFDEKKTKHGMLRDNISWEAISTKLSTRTHAVCCGKWYQQLSSPLVSQGLWLDTDDYRLLDALQKLDACCIDDVDWDNLIKHRPGDICRKRWDQMVRHIGGHREKSFTEQLDVLSKRYCPEMLQYRKDEGCSNATPDASGTSPH